MLIRILLFFLACQTSVNNILAQSPGMIWQRCLGDSLSSRIYSMKSTNDGNFILSGTVSKNNGDVWGFHGGAEDGWIIKLNSLGDTLWTRAIGSHLVDGFADIIQTVDGGFIACGATSKHPSNENMRYNFYIVKLSAEGDIQWESIYGGDNYDEAFNVLQTIDGGYLVLGKTQSYEFGVTGFHYNNNLSASNQKNDVWLIKLSPNGLLEWQKCFGGSLDDVGGNILATNDGNYIISAQATGIGGDISSTNGNEDAWLVKINPSGGIIWEKTYGGTGMEYNPTVINSTSGGYYLAYTSESIDGNSIGNHGGRDIIITKVDESGNVIWSKAYGGSWHETIGFNPPAQIPAQSLSITADDGIIASAYTQSTDGDVSGLHNPNGDYDVWVFSIDKHGQLQWQKCLGGSHIDRGVAVIADTLNNTFMIAGNTESNDGDVSRNRIVPTYNVRTNWWLIKLGPVNTITGTAFNDLNANGILDNGEPLLTGVQIKSVKPGHEKSTYSIDGIFINEVDTGAYVTTAYYSPYHASLPNSFTTANHANFFNKDTINFAIQSIPGIYDLKVNGFPLGTARPGFPVAYQIIVQNVGTEAISSGKLRLVKDSRLTLSQSSNAISSIINDTITFDFTNINVGNTLNFLLEFAVHPPPLTELGDTLRSVYSVSHQQLDQNPYNDSTTLTQIVFGSYDPNDKSEIHSGKINSSFVMAGKKLQFMIRFQNTGTDTAFKVIVRDTLDAKLNWDSFEMIASSHTYRFEKENGDKLSWTFDNINLVDSNQNEPSSHGYIVYGIKPKSSTSVNDIIHNWASIYFDYNLPIVTNDAFTIVEDEITVLPVELLTFQGNLNNNKVMLHWKVGASTNFNLFEIERKTNESGFEKVGSVIYSASTFYNFIDNISTITEKRIFYRLKLINDDGSYSYSRILMFENGIKSRFSLSPNPVLNNTNLTINSPIVRPLTVEIIDINGNIVTNFRSSLAIGLNVIPLKDTNRLKPGMYVVRIWEGTSHLKSITFLKL